MLLKTCYLLKLTKAKLCAPGPLPKIRIKKPDL